MSEPSTARPTLVLITILAVLLSLAATLVAARPAAAQSDFIAELSGAAEVPGPGDPDGGGFASVFIDPAAGEVCGFIEVGGIAAATAAHIHAGAAGVAGSVVVTLPTPDTDGVGEGCVTGLDTAVLQDIHDNPTNYYVNVHNADFPDGAVRGQLGPAPTQLFAGLAGDAEVPGPGDPDGSGFSVLEVFVDAGRVCGFIEVQQIADATAAHIHAGAAGVAGDIVVTLFTPDPSGIGEGCIDGLDPVLLQAIVDDPASYYVNVHTADFPNGAVRGQLGLEPPPPPDCEPGVLCNGLLSPGTYTYTGFGTDVTFTTVDEWFFLADELPSMNLFPPADPAGMFAFSFGGAVYADPCSYDSDTMIGDSPAELMAWLDDRSFLELSDPVPVTYGGATGLQVELISATTPAECTEHPWAIVFAFPGEGDFHFETGSVGRLVALDVNGETIVFILEYVAFEGSGDPTSFLLRAQGVLDSLVWALGAAPPPASPGGSPAPQLPNTAVLEERNGAHTAGLVAGAVVAVSTLFLVRRVVAGRRT